MKHPTIVTAALFGLGLSLAACVGGPPPPPPALMAETMPNPPVTVTPLIWQPGHWEWTGASYVWQPGQYVPREGHSDLWLHGGWESTASGWIWRPGRWM